MGTFVFFLIVFLAAPGCQGSTAGAQQLMAEDPGASPPLHAPSGGPEDQQSSTAPPSTPGNLGVLPPESPQSAAGQSQGEAEPPYQPSTIGSVAPSSPNGAAVLSSPATPSERSSYLLFNQKWLEGQFQSSLDLTDVDAVFWHIFSRLPDDVVVYPSENYYYYILYVDRRQTWGNIRLPAGRRENGVLSFAYFEFKESPYVSEPRAGGTKYFTDADGVRVEELDRFTYSVTYRQRKVTFHLHELSQEPPKLFQLGDGEVSLMRTFDESGYQFFLIFNERKNFFLWVLNEEEPLPDVLQHVEDDLLVGRRSGFAFWQDDAHDGRKILIAIRGQNATRNDYYDGPFDQLADNYVDQTRISEYVIRASPSLRGRIDKYGYFTDRVRSSRVSISPYYVYFDQDALKFFLRGAKNSGDPYFFISRKGLNLTPTPTPTPSPQGS